MNEEDISISYEKREIIGEEERRRWEINNNKNKTNINQMYQYSFIIC